MGGSGGGARDETTLSDLTGPVRTARPSTADLSLP